MRDSGITAAEVREWFGRSRKPVLSDALCDEAAGRLNKMRWPCDPPAADPDPPEPEIDTDKWWDFQGVADAANTLLDCVPGMLWHWERLRRLSETRDGYEAIKAFGEALTRALPYIKFPLGEYERRTHHKRPKDWAHTGARDFLHHW
jgi:hypothetical protein